MMTCPTCGRPLQAGFSLAGYRQRHLAEFETSALTPWQPPITPTGGAFEASRERPIRALNIESDFLTPLLQAGALGVFVGLGGLYAAWQLDLAWHLSCLGGLSVTGLGFAAIVGLNRKLLWQVEKITHTDLDGDGQTGEPAPPAPPMEVIHKTETGKITSMYRLALPASLTTDKLLQFAQGAPVKGLSQGVWTGGGNLFSRAEFDTLMSELERAGIVVWIDPQNHAQGRQLTRAGLSALKYWSQ